MGRPGQRLSGSKWLPEHFESSGYNKESKYYPGEKLPVLFVQEKPLCSLVFSICQKEVFRQRFISVCEKEVWMGQVPEVATRLAKKPKNFCGAAVPQQPELPCSSVPASRAQRCRMKEIDARWYLPRGGSSLWNPQVERRRRWLICKRLRGHRPQRKSFYFGRFLQRKKRPLKGRKAEGLTSTGKHGENLKSRRKSSRRGSCFIHEDQ